MPLYLDQYTGTGARGDEFRPAHGLLVPGWAAADLRPNQAVLAGRCLLYAPVTLPADVAGGLEPIADQPGDSLTATRRNRIFNALGEGFGGRDNKVDTILADLLFSPRSRWNPVTPSTRGAVKQIVFHEQVWASETVAPMRQTDMDPTDNFTRANETPLAGNWTKNAATTGTINLASNALAVQSGGPTYYWNANAFANDQFCQISCSSNVGTTCDLGACVRAATATDTKYFANSFFTNEALYKAVAGSYTQIAAITTSNLVASEVLECQAEGSTIRYVTNGTTRGSTTDTAIASGKAAILKGDTAARITFWQGGDITAGGGGSGITPKCHYYSGMRS